MPSSSPLTGDLDSARELEDAGASALILPSLFEESILASEAAAARFFYMSRILALAKPEVFFTDAG